MSKFADFTCKIFCIGTLAREAAMTAISTGTNTQFVIAAPSANSTRSRCCVLRISTSVMICQS